MSEEEESPDIVGMAELTRHTEMTALKPIIYERMPPLERTPDYRAMAMSYANNSSPVDRPTVGEAERQRHMELNYTAEAERARRVEEYERKRKRKLW